MNELRQASERASEQAKEAGKKQATNIDICVGSQDRQTDRRTGGRMSRQAVRSEWAFKGSQELVCSRVCSAVP